MEDREGGSVASGEDPRCLAERWAWRGVQQSALAALALVILALEMQVVLLASGTWAVQSLLRGKDRRVSWWHSFE